MVIPFCLGIMLVERTKRIDKEVEVLSLPLLSPLPPSSQGAVTREHSCRVQAVQLGLKVG